MLKIESHQDMDEDLNPRMKELAAQLKFNDEFFNSVKAKEKAKTKLKEQTSLSQMLRRAY